MKQILAEQRKKFLAQQ